jgi:hypothetical protein
LSGFHTLSVPSACWDSRKRRSPVGEAERGAGKERKEGGDADLKQKAISMLVSARGGAVPVLVTRSVGSEGEPHLNTDRCPAVVPAAR